jgi:hypothetical protein
MCRSVMIKGLEAMVIESFTTARHYGVEDAVIASLQETFPGIDWEKQAPTSSSASSSTAAAAAKRCARWPQTVREAGLEPFSAAARPSARPHGRPGRRRRVRQRGTPGFARSADWRTEADRILAHGASNKDPPKDS